MSAITFIVNPKSGTGKSRRIPALIHAYLPQSGHTYRIRHTEYAGHAKVIVNEEIANGTRVIVAVGGDGTVNEVASGLLHSRAALGIVPTGSGNGLARHLGIPMSARAALEVVANGNILTVDTAQINGIPFFCTAGIGFDAVVAERFSTIKGRGLFNYIRACLQEFNHYHCESVQDGTRSYQGFLLTFCNANQYGNNAFISPLSDIQDGRLELIQMDKPRWWQLPLMAFRFRNKGLHHSKFFRQQAFSSLTLLREKSGPLHIDGDPAMHTGKLDIQCVPQSLRVLVPA